MESTTPTSDRAGDSQHPAPRWRRIDPADLSWVSWDGAYAVYHRPAGKTHFVNAATALLVSEGSREPFDAAQACALLAAADGPATDPSFQQDVVATLMRLEELGLVDPA